MSHAQLELILFFLNNIVGPVMTLCHQPTFTLNNTHRAISRRARCEMWCHARARFPRSVNVFASEKTNRDLELDESASPLWFDGTYSNKTLPNTRMSSGFYAYSVRALFIFRYRTVKVRNRCSSVDIVYVWLRMCTVIIVYNKIMDVTMKAEVKKIK